MHIGRPRKLLNFPDPRTPCQTKSKILPPPCLDLGRPLSNEPTFPSPNDNH